MGSLPRFNSKFIVIAVSVILLLYFVVFPMGILLYDSIMVNGAINFGNYADVYSQDVNWRALSNTVQLSLLVMVASVIYTFRWPGLWPHRMPGKKTYRNFTGCQLYDPSLCWCDCLGTAFKSQRRLFEFDF